MKTEVALDKELFFKEAMSDFWLRKGIQPNEKVGDTVLAGNNSEVFYGAIRKYH
jgi:hypothetical protein